MVPEVKKCKVDQCFYWMDGECRAHAILVGSGSAACHTFAQSSMHTNKHGQGEVGACHVKDCIFNDYMFCHACDDIEVHSVNNKAVCATYRPR